MFNKILNYIFGGSVVVGLFVLLGTAGASDLNKIDWGTVLFQSGLSLIMVLGGLQGLYVNNQDVTE